MRRREHAPLLAAGSADATFDFSRKSRIPRLSVPLIQICKKLLLGTWFDRNLLLFDIIDIIIIICSNRKLLILIAQWTILVSGDVGIIFFRSSLIYRTFCVRYEANVYSFSDLRHRFIFSTYIPSFFHSTDGALYSSFRYMSFEPCN